FGNGGDYTTPNELRAMYDKMGIEFGVQLPPITVESGYHHVSNEESYEMVQAHPETYAWFCNVDPRWGLNSPDTDFSYWLKRYKALGARGVGEITANVYFDDARVMSLFRHCEAEKMPVLFHIGNAGMGDYGLIDELHLPRLERVLAEFPRLQFIGHSQKFWAEISGDCTLESRGGYPTGKVAPGGRVVELLRKYSNMTCDLSAGSGGNAIMRDPEFGYAFLEEFRDRLYFGTDICDPRNEFELTFFLDRAVENGKISQTAYEKICRSNALELLGRSEQ
ncbi:MAG: amidohydrolase family protein, partial [Clostridia bacterium]